MPDISEYAWLAYFGLYCITKYWTSSLVGYDQDSLTVVAVTSLNWTFVGTEGKAVKKNRKIFFKFHKQQINIIKNQEQYLVLNLYRILVSKEVGRTALLLANPSTNHNLLLAWAL